MKTIDLSTLEEIPKEFLNQLQNLSPVFKENISFDKLLDNNSIVSLIERINSYCLKNRIFGYHYTRAIPTEIQKKGLVCRKGDDIRNAFITNFGNLFTADEKIEIKKSWSHHFDHRQQASRDYVLFFNFTLSGLKDGSAEPLLTNFGGEQVYMPLQELTEIRDKVKCIGKSLILRCRLDPNKINTFFENPWGRIAVSTYHCKINPEALQNDQDGYQNIDVRPEDIDIVEYNGLSTPANMGIGGNGGLTS